jgi:hypothetical protein
MSDLTDNEKKIRHRAQARAWAVANPERVKANQRRWAAENPEKIRAYARKAARKSNGHANPTGETRSGPCGNPGCAYIGPLHLDHWHQGPKKGQARGWVCGPCNRALGLLRDNLLTISGLADYLRLL